MIVGDKIDSENKLQSFKETLSPNLVSSVLHKQVRTMVGGYVGGGIEYTGIWRNGEGSLVQGEFQENFFYVLKYKCSLAKYVIFSV